MLDAHVNSPVRRVVLVVLDGLRPDAVRRFELLHFLHLAQRGSSTFSAQTVNPSVTACAMASLLTGASPERHGLRGERFFLPNLRATLHPLPRVLAQHAQPTSVFLSKVPPLWTGLAHRIASFLGVGEARFAGERALEVLAAAQRNIETQTRGLILLHWLDADRAGHEHGWMSPEYAAAARAMDHALGFLVSILDLVDPSTLLIAMADHGGGGVDLKHHNSDHPADRTIPVVLAGGAVTPGGLGHGVSLLDVPATVLWALGLPVPESYAGRALTQAFQALPVAA